MIMPRYTFSKFFLPLLALTALSFQVNITINVSMDVLMLGAYVVASVTFKCPSIRPGICCALPRRLPVGRNRNFVVIFEGLHVIDIATVWDLGHADIDNPAVRTTGCAGQVHATRTGPGTWSYRFVEGRLGGGSYVTLPQTLPPDTTTSLWLQMEGVLGLVWGGQKWFVNDKARLFFSGRSVGSIMRRDIRSAQKGTVYARPPRKDIYPSSITVNGSEYTSAEDAGDFVYTETGTGSLLNLTDWFV